MSEGSTAKATRGKSSSKHKQPGTFPARRRNSKALASNDGELALIAEAEGSAAELEDARREIKRLEDERRHMLAELAAARDAVAVAEDWKREVARQSKRAIDEAARARASAAESEKRATEAEAIAGSWRLAAGEARDELSAAEKSLVSARQRQRKQQQEVASLSKQLKVSQRELESAAAPSQAERTGSSVFAWPGSSEGLKAAGTLECDDQGIRGTAWFVDRPDMVPVVEVRIGDRLVGAQFCSTEQSANGRWPFAFSWSQFSEHDAGRNVVLRVAGLDQNLGRARVPDDLHDYHLSPAALASKLVGGSVEEAAEYHLWIAETEGQQDLRLARDYHGSAAADWPTITIIVFGSDEQGLAETLGSLRDQAFEKWEALVLTSANAVGEGDPRVKTVAPAEIRRLLSDYPPEALFSFIESGDMLSPTALLHLAVEAGKAPGFTLIYSDEDRIDARSGVRGLPHMKGQWSPDLALAQDYVSRACLVRRKDVGDPAEFTSASVYALALRAALSPGGSVRHLPFVLYHRSAANVREDEAVAEAIEAVVEGSTETCAAKVVRLGKGRWKIDWPLPEPSPRVSLIVPTRDRVDLLRVAVDGFLNDTDYDNLEVLIADNESEQEETRIYLEKVAAHPRVRVIPCPGPFNFSRINNFAAQQASGSIIGLMNNDLKVLDPEWLKRMVAYAARPDIGIVGAKLLHGDDTVQHAGVTLGIGIASHLYKSFPRDAQGHNGRLVLAQDLSAVTAACMLIRRDVWAEVGGLDEDFPVAYNDVDLCLKVTDRGYRIVWTPEAILYHLESQSRGKETTPDKRHRLEQEKARLLDRWGEKLAADPFHSPNLSVKDVDARLAFPSRAAPPWRPVVA